MNYFACHYTYPDNDPGVIALRPEHRQFLAALKEEGILVASGPYIDGLGSALVVIRLPESADTKEALAVMNDDPFYREGVLAGRDIRPWNPVLNIF